jgi:60 kDa SS-A/Ro ribonucleoprotein
LGRKHEAEALPQLVKQFERFKADLGADVPDLPFTMLSALPLTAKHWMSIARSASWQTTRMNLNAFARHGVFENARTLQLVAKRLRDAREIARARVFPYQLLMAHRNCDAAVPQEIREALEAAMELAIANVPKLSASVVVCPDVSGSMSSPITGHRTGATTSVRCIDVAALVAAAVVRKNPSAVVLPFEQSVVPVELDSRDSVMKNAGRLASIGGGGTNCSAPIRLLNERKVKADLVIFVSGGFSDKVFEVISAFASGQLEADHWVARIEAV